MGRRLRRERTGPYASKRPTRLDAVLQSIYAFEKKSPAITAGVIYEIIKLWEIAFSTPPRFEPNLTRGLNRLPRKSYLGGLYLLDFLNELVHWTITSLFLLCKDGI